MEMENMSGVVITSKDEEDHDVSLPGFRFHPTDEELVGFYLRRKAEKRAISIELIKQIDIYKYDPWDLPKASNVGDKEWYFFCKRGRKYRNSIRPNRVTSSGFWKATGIDKPIYSTTINGEARDCIGLKKSLVYYRGSAGKGTKTDWMMHEFRLPADHDKSTKHIDVKTISQEAEVWTLCRIFKRNVAYKKSLQDLKEMASKRNNPIITASSKTCSLESDDCNNQSYISFSDPVIIFQNKHLSDHLDISNQRLISQIKSSEESQQNPSTSSDYYSSFWSPDYVNGFSKHAEWDELGSVVEFASDKFIF